MKKGVAFGFVSLVLLSLVLMSFASAVSVPVSSLTTGGTSPSASSGNFFSDFLNSWEAGGANLDRVTVKYLFLILFIVLIFSILRMAEFPKNFALQLGIAVVVSFLATFYITPDEFWGILTAYTALGVTLGIFVPIAILVFFTIIIMMKASPIGVFFSRVLWLIFSVWLFLRGLLIVLIKSGTENWETITFGTSANKVLEVTSFGSAKVSSWAKPIYSLTSPDTLQQVLNTSFTTGVVLLVAALFIFIVAVVMNRWMDKKIKEAMAEAETENLKNRMRKGAMFYGTGAEVMDETTTKKGA